MTSMPVIAVSKRPAVDFSHHIRTLGQDLLQRYGERVHKIAIDAGMTCPNRDGSIGIGGCSFCNVGSFSPNGRKPNDLARQIESGRQVLRKRTGARKYLAYFQAYTNTYASYQQLQQLYDQALSEPDVIGLAVGTRPDCVSDDVVELLAQYQDQGHEIWLELGLQSAFDETLQRVNRGHGLAEYQRTVTKARQRGLKVCTHLILGLPGESDPHYRESLARVLELGTDGLKFHPLHVVKGTQLAREWHRGDYQPLSRDGYVRNVVDLIQQAPDDMIYHRLTGTASPDILLAPQWCSEKWRVLNSISQTLNASITASR